jgi:phosphopentomutase
VRRVFVVVLDSLGVGALPDAAAFGDEGTHTLDHTARAAGPLVVPQMEGLGLGNVAGVSGVPEAARPEGCFGRMRERSPGKDTSTGHWEMMGLVLERQFPTFSDGFPREVVGEVVRRAGLPGVLGNVPASGTVILEQLGEESVASGKPIVYTSADSVFQVAAHEGSFGLERLYEVCRVAREVLDPLGVGRVIARPFVEAEAGSGPRWRRTYNRRDWSLEPFGPTALDRLMAAGVPTRGVGKIEDIFAGRGVSEAIHTEGDRDGMRVTLELARTRSRGLVFVNLVDFDMLYGHRRDPDGYARNLEAFDRELGELRGALREGDLVILTADHGNDPTFTRTTDHTREHVPVLAFGPALAQGVDLGTRESFADVGATVEEAFGLQPKGAGRSFLGEIGGR